MTIHDNSLTQKILFFNMYSCFCFSVKRKEQVCAFAKLSRIWYRKTECNAKLAGAEFKYSEAGQANAFKATTSQFCKA